MYSSVNVITLTTIWTSLTYAAVPMIKMATWEKNGWTRQHAYCTFTITKQMNLGAWEMTINTNIPTKRVVVSYHNKVK